MSSRRSLALPLSTFCAFLVALILCPPLHAATDEDLLRLHQVRLAAQKSLGDFYMYNGMEGDQRYARMIGESVQAAQASLDALGEMPGDASTALRPQLLQQWKLYRDRLQGLMDAMRSKGYTDLQPVADLADSNQRLMQLSQELYHKMQLEMGQNVPPLTQQSREQSLLMQGIAVDYASRSASVGTSFFGGGEERAIDVLVGEFSTRLQTLSQAEQNTPEISAALGSIGTKWRYIEKSLLNYNENTVPFLVNKYSDSIIEGLEDVSAQYAANQL